MNLQSYIEHTVLKPDLTDLEVDQAVAVAKEHGLFGVCVPPFWVKRAARELLGSSVQLVTVAGFPLGYHMTETKLEEIKLAIRDGAREIDMVMNISAFKIGFTWVKIELAKASELCHRGEVLLKVILETSMLQEEEIIKACKWCSEAGVDFVKTSTGFLGAGASPEIVALMRSSLPSSVGIKASGGIKTREAALALIQAGADRIGTSNGPALVTSVS